MQKITKKIIGFKVIVDKPATEETKELELESMHEGIDRPEVLIGSTYKLKNPMSEHAMYITINDYVLNEGTDHELRRPYEIFINSKNMEHFQWVIALTRVISAVFRKGGDVCFLVDELGAVFDPKGGYFKKGKYMPSLVADIGSVIKDHLMILGLLSAEELSDHTKEILAQKRKEFEATNSEDENSSGYPEKAVLCSKCNVKASILMDGCMTCLNCADSKCG